MLQSVLNMGDRYQFQCRNYRHRNRVAAELCTVVQKYRSLTVKQEVFVFSDGRPMELVNLSGTIPVSYRNATYHIPVCIWLMDTHPENAPVCFVKPTPKMKINISHHVDHAGKIYAPYLHDWSASNSDLMTLVEVLCLLFGEHPPLYQVSGKAAAQTPAPTNMPPYPTQSSSFFMPMAGGTGSNPPYPIQPAPHFPVANTGNPPYPIRPQQTTPYPPYPVPASTQSPSATGTITEQHIHISLVSAAEDKVRRHLMEFMGQAKAEIDTLDKIQHELNQGKARLTHLTTTLESEQTEWEKILTTLQDKDSELDAALVNLSNQGELDVDEAVVTTAPLYKQLLKAFAEEAATEDAIYYLGEGLRRGVIDLDVFLKHVRSLSRKQFTLRAIMHKCRNKAGLAC